MPDDKVRKAPYPMQIYIPVKVREAFDKKLEQEFSIAPSRSKTIRTWIEAFVEDRLKIVEGEK
jgi:bifunctional DNA-binding transcriptional regulator/antitoxin component of YhaV-PrlF toxin-antitoxin module